MKIPRMRPADVPGHLTEQEGDWLQAMARHGRILEIGAYRGRSTCYLAISASRVVSCDHFQGQRRLLPHQAAVDFGRVRRDWHVHVAAVGVNQKVDLIETDSRALYRALRTSGTVFDLVFVDGGHDYACVSADTNCFNLLSPGGVIAFHDYCNADFPDVRRAVDEWRVATGGLEEIASVGSIAAFRHL